MQLRHTFLWLPLAFLVAMPARADDPWTAAADTLVYSDTDNVRVISPQLALSYSDDERLTASARIAIDSVSAASVDVISHATTGFHEIRYQGDFDLSIPFGDHTPSVGYRVSVEPDYLSHTLLTGWSSEFFSKTTTLAAGYSLTLDTVGRHGTPASAFEASLTTHSANLSLTQLVNPNALVRFVYTLTAQHGYLEKPYRFVPLFSEAALTRLRDRGQRASLENFDANRLSVRPTENVPDFRLRQAFAVRALHYVELISGAARLDYQFYVDNWGVLAHALEGALQSALSERLRLDLWARLYRQNGAAFWQRTYAVSSVDVIPRYRTADRALSPYTTVSGGVHFEYRRAIARFYVDASLMHTVYDDFLYLDHVTAVVAQVGIRVTPVTP